MKNKIDVVVRWIARIISSLFVSFFLLMVIGGSISDFGPITFEGILVVGFSIVFLLNVIYAWFKEGIGGTTLIFISILFAVFIYITAGSHRILAAVGISFPFLFSGILFLIASKITKIK